MTTDAGALGSVHEWRALWKAVLTERMARCREPRLLTDMPGNVGDRFISGGTLALLRDGGIDAPALRVDEIAALTQPMGTLLVPGSGALHRQFQEWLPDLLLRAARHFETVIILPSSFDLTVPLVRSVVARPNVECFVRDTLSWSVMRDVSGATLGPDMAIFHPTLTAPTARPGNASELLALRTDDASPTRRTPWRPSARNRDVSVNGTTESFLSAIDDVDAVVTDRLHVALVAALRGRRVHFVDPYDDKISAAAPVTLGVAGASLLDRHTTQWLLDRGDLE